MKSIAHPIAIVIAQVVSVTCFSLSPAFVITGGPCSGKTEAIGSLETTLSGWELFKVPEAATFYFQRGGTMPFGQPVDESGRYSPSDRNLLWEAWLVELKISLENHAHAAAATAFRNSGCQGALLCDRGIFDSKAYLDGDEEWNQLLAMVGWDESELMTRYTGVLAMEVAPQESYNFGNEARHESYAEALAVHDRTIEAWSSAATRQKARCAPGVDSLRKDFAAEFNIGGRAQAPGKITSELFASSSIPNLCHVQNPKCGGGFATKLRTVQSCLEAFLEQETARETLRDRKLNSANLWTMPTSFIIERANAIAAAPNLGLLSSSESSSSHTGVEDLYSSSLALLRELQEVRKGGSNAEKLEELSESRTPNHWGALAKTRMVT